jgi:hypothetical protein
VVPEQENHDLKQGRRGVGGVLQQTLICHPALNAQGDVQIQQFGVLGQAEQGVAVPRKTWPLLSTKDT